MTTTITADAAGATGLLTRRPHFTLGPLDLHVPRGFVTGMIGVNGAGKTTTLRSMLGLTPPDRGQVLLPPMDRVGVAFDTPFLLPEWRISEAEAVYAAFRPDWDGAFFGELCRRFGLDPTVRVSRLSRGQGGKLMIALAMGDHPELLLLDEPTSGLDPASRADVIDVLREFMTDEGATVLLSSHIMSDLEGFADFLVFLDRGMIVQAGSADELVARFAYVSGPLEALTDENGALVNGLRRSSSGFDGVIRATATAAFDSRVQITEPTLEQLAVHLRHPLTRES